MNTKNPPLFLSQIFRTILLVGLLLNTVFATYSIKLTEEKADDIFLTFTMSPEDYTITERLINGEICTEVTLKTAPKAHTSGNPDLPHASKGIIIDDRAKMYIEVIDIASSEIVTKR